MDMTERQATAFANPCVVAEQCIDPRFKEIGTRWSLRGDRVMISSILTFNFGME